MNTYIWNFFVEQKFILVVSKECVPGISVCKFPCRGCRFPFVYISKGI